MEWVSLEEDEMFINLDNVDLINIEKRRNFDVEMWSSGESFIVKSFPTYEEALKYVKDILCKAKRNENG